MFVIPQDPMQRQMVCTSGGTVPANCGEIRTLNEMVTESGLSLNGLFSTNACTEPGSSGGPVFTRQPVMPVFQAGAAIGITIGRTPLFDDSGRPREDRVCDIMNNRKGLNYKHFGRTLSTILNAQNLQLLPTGLIFPTGSAVNP
jgi:hypothetical protein